MKFYMDLQKMNKINHFVEKICVFEESHYQDWMEAITRHCRETEQMIPILFLLLKNQILSHFNDKGIKRKGKS